MKPKVYLETTVISYLVGRLSRDLIIAAHQELTREWWESRSKKYAPFVSYLAIQELSQGDRQIARDRLQRIEKIPVLGINEKVPVLAQRLIDKKIVPRKSVEDALHIAIATVHGMDFLVTWNCKHIANAEMRHKISMVCFDQGYEPPVICTPEELMGE